MNVLELEMHELSSKFKLEDGDQSMVPWWP
jgi:hypothetical protein